MTPPPPPPSDTLGLYGGAALVSLGLCSVSTSCIVRGVCRQYLALCCLLYSVIILRVIRKSETEPPHVRDETPWRYKGIIFMRFIMFFQTNVHNSLRPPTSTKRIGTTSFSAPVREGSSSVLVVLTSFFVVPAAYRTVVVLRWLRCRSVFLPDTRNYLRCPLLPLASPPFRRFVCVYL